MILTGRQAASKKGTGQWWGVSGSVQVIGKFIELVSSHSCFFLGTVWLICDIAILLKSFIMTSECVRNIITQGMTLDEGAELRWMNYFSNILHVNALSNFQPESAKLALPKQTLQWWFRVRPLAVGVCVVSEGKVQKLRVNF